MRKHHKIMKLALHSPVWECRQEYQQTPLASVW